jgi:hypothetical protein
LILCIQDYHTRCFCLKSLQKRSPIFVKGKDLAFIYKYIIYLTLSTRRFSDPNHPDFVFKPEYHKRIPADGYHIYASSIWDKVLTNKDLDLPTQQELLAQYRCDEIANVITTISNRSNLFSNRIL